MITVLESGTSRRSVTQSPASAYLIYLLRRREALQNWLALAAAMFIVLAAPSVVSDEPLSRTAIFEQALPAGDRNAVNESH